MQENRPDQRDAADETSDREAHAAAARSGGLRVVHLEGGPDQVVDEIDLGAGEEPQRHGVDQHAGAALLDQQVVRRAARHKSNLYWKP
jgi:hypothetical protein